MTKYGGARLLILTILILLLALCGCEERVPDEVMMSEHDRAVKMISEATGLDTAGAQELYAMLIDTGLTKELRYVTRWNGEDGEFYRVRVFGGTDKREIYFSGGSVDRITDGEHVLYRRGTEGRAS